MPINYAKQIRLLIPLLACITLSGCQQGQIDKYTYWGQTPDNKRIAELKAKGVKTIVNVRLNSLPGLEKRTHEAGMNYVHLPTGLFKPPTRELIKKMVAIIRDPNMRPVYINDQAAHDRTQFYVAVCGIANDGWSTEKANKVMYRNGLRHWWPWFYKYKHVLKENEDEIYGKTSIAGSQAEE